MDRQIIKEQQIGIPSHVCNAFQAVYAILRNGKKSPKMKSYVWRVCHFTTRAGRSQGWQPSERSSRRFWMPVFSHLERKSPG
jgi:hypothetical protein